jgi:hypothetical protein
MFARVISQNPCGNLCVLWKNPAALKARNNLMISSGSLRQRQHSKYQH